MTLPTLKNQLVLISGVNGYIAAQTAKSFLDAGYCVRGTVRSKSSAEGLLSVLQRYVEANRLEIVEVKDITQPGVFDTAVQGVHAIAHTASPVSFSFIDPEYVMGTAVRGTASILDSALRLGPLTLKSVIYMSSIAAIIGPHEAPYTYTEADWNTESEGEVTKKGAKAGGVHIYRASKAAGEKAFWAFKVKHKPDFTMVAINPVVVQGPPLAPPEDPAKLNETVAPIWTVFSGGPIPPPSLTGGIVDVRDVADLLVTLVEENRGTDEQRYIACGGMGNSQALADILRAHYPARRDIIQVGEPGKGYLPGYVAAPNGITIDACKAAKARGKSWIPYEQTVLDTAKAFEKYL